MGPVEVKWKTMRNQVTMQLIMTIIIAYFLSLLKNLILFIYLAVPGLS